MTLINRGEIETASLVEWLAVDHLYLLKKILVNTSREQYIEPILEIIDSSKKHTTIAMMQTIGLELYNQIMRHDDQDLVGILTSHQSDTVRCWAVYCVAEQYSHDITLLFNHIKRFAADNHFCVREVAWMAVRPFIINNLPQSIALLTPWASSSDEYLRRFASEATRPRGVWCKHINELKLKPELGLPIIEKLKSDKSKYVRDSVGNWLNDASKSKPKFVISICEKWNKEEPDCMATNYIIKRALRSIRKKI